MKEARLRKGVRQSCPLSPYLFNLFFQTDNTFYLIYSLVINMMKEKTKGVKINGQKYHFIRFADDIVMLAEAENELKQKLELLDRLLSDFELKINTSKTKNMLIEEKKDENKVINIRLKDNNIHK